MLLTHNQANCILQSQRPCLSINILHQLPFPKYAVRPELLQINDVFPDIPRELPFVGTSRSESLLFNVGVGL